MARRGEWARAWWLRACCVGEKGVRGRVGKVCARGGGVCVHVRVYACNNAGVYNR